MTIAGLLGRRQNYRPRLVDLGSSRPLTLGDASHDGGYTDN